MNKLAAVAVLALGALAWADVPPANSTPCRDRDAGVACTADDGTAGTCQPSMCGYNDYSQGPPPKRGQRPCLKCVATAPAPAPPKPHDCQSIPGPALAGLAALVAAFTRRR